jgi:hypothetical protein
VHVTVLLLLSACEVPHPGEAMVQSAQQAHTDPLAAARSCRALPPKTAGECEALLAGQVALDDLETAADLCGEIEDALWRDECWFLVAEATAASQGPESAVTACGQAGRFDRNCLAHLWLDAATRAHAAHADQPVAAWDAYAPTAAWTLPQADPDALMKRHVSTFFDARFNPTGAGTDPPPIDASWCTDFDGTRARSCRQAATESLQRQLNRAAGTGIDRERLCGDGPLAERVAVATGVRWVADDALDKRAAALIARSCEPVREGAPGPLDSPAAPKGTGELQ